MRGIAMRRSVANVKWGGGGTNPLVRGISSEVFSGRRVSAFQKKAR